MFIYLQIIYFMTSKKLISGGQDIRFFRVGWNKSEVYYFDVLFIYTIHVMFINLQRTWGIWSRHIVSRKLCLAKLAIQVSGTGVKERYKV